MALTTLDPQTALLVIDLQKSVVSLPGVHPMADVIRHAAELTQAFRTHRLPVVLVNVAGRAPGRTEQPPRAANPQPDGADLIAELHAQPGDHTVTKRSWGAFMHTGLQAQLERLGVTQLVIAGVATSIGVESTARQAYELGFNVTLATDAMTDLSAEAHANSVTRIFPRLGETGLTRDVIELLARARARRPNAPDQA